MEFREKKLKNKKVSVSNLGLKRHYRKMRREEIQNSTYFL